MRNASTRRVLVCTIAAALLSGCRTSEPPPTANTENPAPAAPDIADSDALTQSFAELPAEEALALEIALTHAAWAGDVAEVERLLEAGADPEGVWGPKARRYLRANDLKQLDTDLYLTSSPLFASVSVAYEDRHAVPAADRGAVVALLLDAGADPNTQWRDSFGQFPLLRAAEAGLHDAVMHLLNAGADPNMSLEGFTQIDVHENDTACALGEAVKQGNVEMARLLLDAGAHPNYGGWVLTPLMRSASLANPEMFDLLLDAVVSREYFRWGNAEVFDAMRKLFARWRRASIDPGDHEQALADCMACFEVLIEHEPNAYCLFASASRYAFEIANPKFHAWYLEQLIAFEPDGPNALEWMLARVDAKDLDGLRGMLDAGLDIDATDDQGYTLLHHAARTDAVSIVTYLIDQGVPINPRDERGKTPLDYTENDEVIQLLQAAGGLSGKAFE